MPRPQLAIKISHGLLLRFLLFSLTLNGCSFLRNCSDDPQCVRILFIGNATPSSMTYRKHLPTWLNLVVNGVKQAWQQKAAGPWHNT